MRYHCCGALNSARLDIRQSWWPANEERKGRTNMAEYATPKRAHDKEKEAKETQRTPEKETADEYKKLGNREAETMENHDAPKDRHRVKHQLHLVEYSDDIVVSKKKVATTNKVNTESNKDNVTSPPEELLALTKRRTCHETLLKELNQGFLEMKRDHKLRSKELQ